MFIIINLTVWILYGHNDMLNEHSLKVWQFRIETEILHNILWLRCLVHRGRRLSENAISNGWNWPCVCDIHFTILIVLCGCIEINQLKRTYEYCELWWIENLINRTIHIDCDSPSHSNHTNAREFMRHFHDSNTYLTPIPRYLTIYGFFCSSGARQTFEWMLTYYHTDAIIPMVWI